MLKCSLCNNKFYDLVLEENEKGEDTLICNNCFGGKIQHRVYQEPIVEIKKEPKKVKIK